MNESLAGALRARSGRRVLLVRLGAVGDVVRALPLAHALRQADPDAFIGWLVEEPSAALLREVQCLDAVHVLPRRFVAAALFRPGRWLEAGRRLIGVRDDLRRARYDIVLDVHGTLKAAWAAGLADVPVTGFAPGGSKELAHLLHDTSLPFPAQPMTRVERALFLGAAAGLLGSDPPHGPEAAVDFGLRFPPARVAAVRDALAGPRPLVVLFPFASAKGQVKRWPIERHVELGGRLAARGARVLLAWGSPREGDEARAAIEAAPRGTASGVTLAPPTDLVELTELLRGADVLVTGDTGPMHLAAAVGTPVVALFGTSDPVVNRPWGRPRRGAHAVIVRQPLAALPVEDVLAAVAGLLPPRG